jgi:hypothetical protein
MQEIKVVNSFFEAISTHDLINLDHTIRAQLPAAPTTFHNIIKLSVKSCPVGPELHPSFDASTPPGFVCKVMKFH